MTGSIHIIISLIHKGGALDDPGNFQPISVVSIIAKVLENTVQLATLLEQNQLLPSSKSLLRVFY